MFDLLALRAAVATHGRVARVVIAGFQGSSPREVGASMLVWAQGQSGTVGGGALEWQAMRSARERLAAQPPTPIPSPQGGGVVHLPEGGARVERVVLGPALGQCCGGAITVLTEVYHAGNLPENGDVIARPTDGSAMPLAVQRLISRARGQGVAPAPQMVQGWMVEPVAKPQRAVWIWGAGHVGRALVAVLAPLPGVAVTWVDTGPERFPETMPANVRALPVGDPGRAVALAPSHAEHLILTYSHALDLDLCHRLLTHGFASCGLIGSATKWARFASRLAGLGHAPHLISSITCPIGNPALGKHPQAIAIGVASAFLTELTLHQAKENTGS